MLREHAAEMKVKAKAAKAAPVKGAKKPMAAKPRKAAAPAATGSPSCVVRARLLRLPRPPSNRPMEGPESVGPFHVFGDGEFGNRPFTPTVRHSRR